jgi:hypothetical protein
MFDNPKKSLIFIGFSTLLAAFSAGSVMVFTDPESSGLFVFLFLYASLFLTSLGFFTISGTLIRQHIFGGIFVLNFQTALRQAGFVSVLLLSSLWLSSAGILYWWVGGSLFAFIILLEGYFHLKN